MRCYRSVVAALNRKSAVWSFANTFMKAFMIQPDIPMQLFSHEGASQPCFLHLYVSLIILGDSNSNVEIYAIGEGWTSSVDSGAQTCRDCKRQTLNIKLILPPLISKLFVFCFKSQKDLYRATNYISQIWQECNILLWDKQTKVLLQDATLLSQRWHNQNMGKIWS